MNTKGRRKVGILAQGAVCHYCALSTMKMFSVTAQHDNTEGDLASVWRSLSLSISSSFWSDDSELRNVYLIMLQSCYYSEIIEMLHDWTPVTITSDLERSMATRFCY